MKAILSLCFIFFLQLLVAAQDFQPSSGYVTAKSFRVTRALKELDSHTEKNTNEETRESKDRAHRQPQYFEFTGADGAPFDNEQNTIQREMGTQGGTQLRANFAGQSSGGSRPFDPSGAVGPNHYVQLINATTFRVYNKVTGSPIGAAQSLGALWNPDTQNNGDPIVLYDKAADRWFLAQFGSFFNNEVYIAVSTSSDPLGSYYTYTFESPSFPDYLKFSVWQDGYYMTSNTNTQRVFAFERDAMLAGTPGARSVFTTFNPPDGGGFFVPVTGCAADGVLPPTGTPCPIFSYSDNGWGGGNQDRLNIYNMTVNWATTNPSATIASANNVSTAAFDASYDNNWDDVSQPGTNQKLDGIGGICMYRGQWKNWNGYNSIVLNWAVRISSSQRSIKWCELRQDQATGVWSMYQEGIYTPDGDTRWMGSILMDDNGSIGLSYMKTNAGSNLYPGLYYTGRRDCDPLGSMPITEQLIVAGTGSQTGTNRNGDYAHGCLDPDGVTLWSTSEYMGGSTGAGAARTRIFSYQIEPCMAAAVSISIANESNPVCIGEPIVAIATPAFGGDAPQFEWFVNGISTGNLNDSLVLINGQNGDILICNMISNEPGLEGMLAASNELTVSVATAIAPAIAIASEEEVICLGEAVQLIAAIENGGNSPSFQWYINNIAVGSNNDTLSYTFNEEQSVTCIVTSSLSCASPSNITSAALIVTPQAIVTPEVSISASTDTITVGESVIFSATATNAGSSPTFQWYINGIALSSATTSTYTTNTIGNGQTITCRIVGQVPCSAITTVTSNGITMTVEQPNAIIEWDSSSQLLVYPNPSMGEVTFKSRNSGTYFLVNEAGQLVREIALNNSNNFTVKLADLAAGVYVVAGQNYFGIVKQRLVIVH